MNKPRADVGEALKSYSRRLLHDFRETVRNSSGPFDRGVPREKALRDFLAARLPGRYGVGEGLVIDSSGGQSQHCDVVIFDHERAPIVTTESGHNIWSFESVYAVAQVKALLSRRELEAAVENIAAYKRLSRKENHAPVGGAPGTRAGKLNPAFGMLIAYEADTRLGVDELQAVIGSVPAEYQVDSYCIISGRVGFRGRAVEGELVLDLVNGTHLLHDEFDDGALAAFVLITVSLMNGIVLGEQSFYPYLKFL